MSTTNWSEVWNLWKSESIHSNVLVTSLTGVDKCFCHPNDSQYSGLFLRAGITNSRSFVLCKTVMVFSIYRTATNMVTNQQGSGTIHQQILALASMPFGDSPLFRNLLPVSFILNVMFV